MTNKKILAKVEGKHHDRKPPYSRKKFERADGYVPIVSLHVSGTKEEWLAALKRHKEKEEKSDD